MPGVVSSKRMSSQTSRTLSAARSRKNTALHSAPNSTMRCLRRAVPLSRKYSILM